MIEDETHPNPPASTARRAAAAIVDWLVAFVLFYTLFAVSAIVLPSAEGDDDLLSTILLVLPGALGVLAYFTWARARGYSLGMKLMGLRIVAVDSGQRPSPRQAFARSLVSLVIGASVFALIVAGFSDRPDAGYSAATWVVITLALAVLALAGLGMVFMLFDPLRRTQQDKLLGLTVVEASPR